MAGLAQIRGMLLEEVILCFLGANGYRVIDECGTDTTLKQGSAGLQVCGRGADHQIDAIANYRLTPPFSHPYRLLVEAKSISGPVPIGVIRNALGVLRDVSEHWRDRRQPRFHYQYAVFTDTHFTDPAQDFGYVQDIFLLPLGKANSMRPVIRELRRIREQDLPAGTGSRRVRHQLRKAIRASLRSGSVTEGVEFAQPLIAAARRIGQALIGMASNGLPLFLVPAPGVRVAALENETPVRITWDTESWYLTTVDRQRLFSFDLPEELFNLYAEREELTEERALDVKEQALAEITATAYVDRSVRVLRFTLDTAWIHRVRVALARREALE